MYEIIDRIKYYNDDPNYGWKLHISFDANNPSVVNIIDQFLNRLKQKYGIHYKIGRNSGQIGKDATIYCGSKNDAKIIAAIILSSIGHLLFKPQGDVLKDDIKFNNKVMGRFTVSQFYNRSNYKYIDPSGMNEFHQYGGKGIPHLNRDVNERVFDKNKEKQHLMDLNKCATQKSNKILIGGFKDYYTGSKKIKNDDIKQLGTFNPNKDFTTKSDRRENISMMKDWQKESNLIGDSPTDESINDMDIRLYEKHSRRQKSHLDEPSYKEMSPLTTLGLRKRKKFVTKIKVRKPIKKTIKKKTCACVKKK